MRWTHATGLTLLVGLSACAPAPPRMRDPVDLALKTCGLGINSQSAAVFKLAYEVATKKGAVEFDSNMSQSIDTQEASILKTLGAKSPDATQAVVSEIKELRACVISQVAEARPMSRPELLEQCRQDVQRRISTPGPIQYGTLRAWNQLIGDKQYRPDKPVMIGFFDTGGGTGYQVKAMCDIGKGKLNDVVGLDPTP